ncbi:hypothetical protein GEMRC1_003054 [Eukaryota sp. GEM-RC1]
MCISNRSSQYLHHLIVSHYHHLHGISLSRYWLLIIEPHFSLSRPYHVTCLSWHPSEPLFLIGWQNGVVTILNTDTSVDHDCTSHTSPVSSIQLTASFSVFSCCTSGLLCSWSLQEDRLFLSKSHSFSPIALLSPLDRPLPPNPASESDAMPLSDYVFVSCADNSLYLFNSGLSVFSSLPLHHL